MSGLGAPARAAAPTPDLAIGTPGASRPSLLSSSMPLDHEVDGLTLLEPLADGTRPDPHRHDRVLGRAFERRNKFEVGLFYSHRRHHGDLAGLACARPRAEDQQCCGACSYDPPVFLHMFAILSHARPQ